MNARFQAHTFHARPAVLAALLWLLVGATSLVGQAAAGPTQNAVSGARVFGTKACVQCHAIKGLGGGAGPDLGLIEARRSFFDLAAAMWNHLPSMRETMAEAGIDRPGLSPQETDDLIAFFLCHRDGLTGDHGFVHRRAS